MVEPDVKTADLLGLILPNPILLEVFGRWDLQSSLQRSADELKEIGAAPTPASTSADDATLGTVLEDLVYDLTFFGTPERELALAKELALQEWTDVTVEELLREIEQATMDAGPRPQLPTATLADQPMTHNDRKIPADAPTARLTREQIESITNTKFSEIGSFEVSAETTDEQIEKAVAELFKDYKE